MSKRGDMTISEMKGNLRMLLARLDAIPKTKEEWQIIYKTLEVLQSEVKCWLEPRKEPPEIEVEEDDDAG